MTRILFVDDHEMVRQALCKALGSTNSSWHFVEAESAHEARAEMQRRPVDLVMLDISLDGESGLDLLRRLRQDHPEVPVLMVSMHGSPVHVRLAIEGGAMGFVAKTAPLDVLRLAVERVLAGSRHLCTDSAEALALATAVKGDNAYATLTPRERELFYLLAKGDSVKAAAAAMGIAPSTASTFKARLFHKMGWHNDLEMLGSLRTTGHL